MNLGVDNAFVIKIHTYVGTRRISYFNPQHVRKTNYTSQ